MLWHELLEVTWFLLVCGTLTDHRCCSYQSLLWVDTNTRLWTLLLLAEDTHGTCWLAEIPRYWPADASILACVGACLQRLLLACRDSSMLACGHTWTLACEDTLMLAWGVTSMLACVGACLRRLFFDACLWTLVCIFLSTTTKLVKDHVAQVQKNTKQKHVTAYALRQLS